MERINKINSMLENGKITKEQARLLKDALEASNRNKEELPSIKDEKVKSDKNGFIIAMLTNILHGLQISYLHS